MPSVFVCVTLSFFASFDEILYECYVISCHISGICFCFHVNNGNNMTDTETCGLRIILMP
jgi:hypothetical protein